MLKRNLPVEPNKLYTILQNFRTAVEKDGLTLDQTDGIKVVLPQGWVHVRASNTESLIRIIVEGAELSDARSLFEWARDRLR